MSRELLDRLLKVIGMLSSSNANEAGVAAGMLMATLKQAGLDIHDLTDIIADGFRRLEKGQRDDEEDKHADSIADVWRDVLRECLEYSHRLNYKDQEFLNSMMYRGRAPTSKQWGWLLDIVNKVRRFQ